MKTQASGTPAPRKSRFLATLFAILLGIAFSPTARAALTTNNWTGSTSLWELGSNWSHGVPSPANAIDLLTDTIPSGARFISIDAAAVSSNLLNGCLTISNLTIAGTSTSPNTLILNANASNTPGNMGLTVGNALTISSHGILSITNSYLYVSGQGLFDDGVIVMNTGTLDTLGSGVAVGYNGAGQMTVQNGTWQASFVNIGNNPGSQGTLTISGGTVESGINVGSQAGSAGTVWLTGGQLLEPGNNGSGLGLYGRGRVTVSNGTWESADVAIGPLGTLTIAGGVSSLSFLDFYGDPSVTSTGTIWITGGQLLNPNGIFVGDMGAAILTVSNGFWQSSELDVGIDESGIFLPGTGTVTVAGGSNIFSTLRLCYNTNCLGMVWLTGGSLIVTNEKVYVGYVGEGRIAVSNGTFLADEIDVGASLGALGILTAAGGQVVVTNGAGRIAVGVAGTSFLPGSGQGHMFVVSGSVLTRELDIGSDNSPQGELSISGGGSLTVLSRMTVGDCDSNGFGIVVMTGGKLYVTNAAHDATLEVRNGVFLLEGGTVVVDRLVVTNGCSGTFDHAGGSLTIGTLVLDSNGDADGDGLPNSWEQQHGLDPLSSTGDNGPDGDPDRDGYSNYQEYLAGSDPQNPLSTPLQIIPPSFQITSILRFGNDIVLTWLTPAGTTNQLQVTGGGSGGAFSTNGFTNLGAQMLIGGSGVITTNYTDVGGATNKPARYYRVRLVP